MAKQALRSAEQAVEVALKSADLATRSADGNLAKITEIHHDLQMAIAEVRQDLQIATTEVRRDLQIAITEVRHDLERNGATFSQSIAGLDNVLRTHEHRFERLTDMIEVYDSVAARAVTDLGRRLDLMITHRLVASSPDDRKQTTHESASRNFEGFRAFCDHFYHRLENRYRGSPTEIARRLRVYLPDVEAAALRCGGRPVLDIGCGRGEWLGLLKRAGIAAFGVDTNAIQIDESQREGLDARLGDALTVLADAEDNSLSVITAFHLVEHMPFETVAWIVREAERILAPGGLLLFETPDTRNVLVGATTFHTDPTHRKPMPEQVLGVLFETVGYYPIDIRHLNPHERLNEFLAKPNFNEELAVLLFGPQDLAVLGTKRREQ